MKQLINLLNNSKHEISKTANTVKFKHSKLVIYECDIDIIIPYYDGKDPYGRRGQRSRLKNIIFNGYNESCTFRVVFPTYDHKRRKQAYYDYFYERFSP